MRGIAWAGKRNADLLVTKEELASLKYPEGGPTAPEKAAAKITVASDFAINLVASEPLIEKVISMDWDERGRLWVAETPEYPNGRRINKNDNMVALWREANPQSYQGESEKRPARDRISVLEDTNGDGVMDKKALFYEGLAGTTCFTTTASSPLKPRTSIGFGTRCRPKPTRKVVLYTGFGNFDTRGHQQHALGDGRFGFMRRSATVRGIRNLRTEREVGRSLRA